MQHPPPAPDASYLARPHEVHRVVLLYSGGLDTSVMLKWIRDQYEAEVIALCVDLGQPGADLQSASAFPAAADKVYPPLPTPSRAVTKSQL